MVRKYSIKFEYGLIMVWLCFGYGSTIFQLGSSDGSTTMQVWFSDGLAANSVRLGLGAFGV